MYKYKYYYEDITICDNCFKYAKYPEQWEKVNKIQICYSCGKYNNMYGHYRIKPGWKEQFCWAFLFNDSAEKDLADLATHLLAGWMKEKFLNDHREVETTDSRPGDRKWICLAACNYTDERHEYSEEDWLKKAENILNGTEQ